MLGMGVAVLETAKLLRPSPRVAGWMLGGAATAVALTAAAALAEVRLPGRAAARVGARLAYALYLTHYPLVPLSLALGGALGGSVVAYWTVFLGLSLASALVVHYFVEKPFLMARELLVPRADR